MTGPIAPIGVINQLTPFAKVADASQADAARAVIPTGETASGLNFASALANGLDAVGAAQNEANQLAVQAATGQLVDPAQLTIATTKAQLMTQMATAIQSKAVTAFNTIMSMQA